MVLEITESSFRPNNSADGQKSLDNHFGRKTEVRVPSIIVCGLDNYHIKCFISYSYPKLAANLIFEINECSCVYYSPLIYPGATTRKMLNDIKKELKNMLTPNNPVSCYVLCPSVSDKTSVLNSCWYHIAAKLLRDW